jgi:hypothetical protein
MIASAPMPAVPGKKFGYVMSSRACETLTRTACARVSRASACARVSLSVSVRACVMCRRCPLSKSQPAMSVTAQLTI